MNENSEKYDEKAFNSAKEYLNLICVCSSFIEYTPVSIEIKDAEEITSAHKIRFEDLVVTLVAIENGDDESRARKWNK
jgi:hypothetical protein